MRNTYISLALLVFLPFISQAATGISGEFGLTFPKGIITNGARHTETFFGVGGRVGVDLDFKLADNFYLEPGLAYVTNGWRTRDGDAVIHTIQLPVDLVFKLEPCKGLLLG